MTGDVLSDEEMSQLEATHTSPDSMTDEQMAAMEQKNAPEDNGFVHNISTFFSNRWKGLKEDMRMLTDAQDQGGLSQEQLMHVAQQVDDVRSAEANQSMNDEEAKQFAKVDGRIAGELDANGPLTAMQALKTVPEAERAYFHDESGFFGRAFNILSIPSTVVAREATVGLQNLNMMPPEAAKNLVSRPEMYAHDIVDYYWKNPQSYGERFARFGAGFAADVLLDPLTYVGLGALSKSAKEATVMGETLKNLDKLSQGERSFIKGASKIEQVIKADGSMARAGEDAARQASRVEKNTQLFSDFYNKKITFDDMKLGADIGQTSMQDLDLAYEAISSKPSYFTELANGDRGVTLGARIPFTNIGFETDLPFGMATRPMGKFMGAVVDWPWEKVAQMNKQGPAYQVVTGTKRLLQGIKTTTGFGNFDDAYQVAMGANNAVREEVVRFSNDWRPKLLNSMKNMNDEQKTVAIKDIVDALEHDVENPSAVLKAFDKKPWEQHRPVTDIESGLEHTPLEKTPFLEKLSPSEGTPEYAAKMERMSRMPDDHKAFVKVARGIFDTMKDEYAKRPGIPFDELNPFGPGWVNNYLPHLISAEYLDAKKSVADAITYGYETLQKSGLNIDRNALGRKYRGSINAANELALSDKSIGVKMFVDDPVTLVSKRLENMSRVIKSYDLMEGAVPHAIQVPPGQFAPEGFVRFQPKEWQAFERKVGELGDEKILKGKDAYQLFTPNYYKESDNIFMPEQVYDRLKNALLPKDHGPFVNGMLKANDAFMGVFRNMSLLGPGFVGMKAQTDIATFLTAGTTNPLRSLVDAARLYLPFEKEGLYHFKDHMGEAYSLSKEELWNLAVRNNVIRSSGIEPTFFEAAENMASTFQQRKTSLGKAADGAYNFYDIATGWRINRAAIKGVDDFSKVAYFIDRLKDGFSPAGAAAAVDKYYYAYNNTGPSMNAVRKGFMFSTFPVKTAERMALELRDGQLGRLTAPVKAANVLMGAFVPDTETRGVLNESLPQYYRAFPIWGPLMPGARAVVSELHWVGNTMDFYLDPQHSIHPAIQAMASWATSRDERDYTDVGDYKSAWRRAGEALMPFVPAPVRDALAMSEINGNVDFGGAFAEKYTPRIPSKDGNLVGKQFDNAYLFGKFMDDQLGKDWLYKMVFPKDVDDSTPAGILTLAQRGNFIKSHFRDLTLGTASMTDMDRNFFVNMGALNRQYNALDQSMKSDLNKIGFLPNADALNDKELMAKIAETNPKAKKLMELDFHREHLKAIYEWVSATEKKYPHTDIKGLLFGSDKYGYDYSEKPQVPQFQEANFNEYAEQLRTAEPPQLDQGGQPIEKGEPNEQ